MPNQIPKISKEDALLRQISGEQWERVTRVGSAMGAAHDLLLHRDKELTLSELWLGHIACLHSWFMRLKEKLSPEEWAECRRVFKAQLDWLFDESRTDAAPPKHVH